jgi:hypothetical protein
MRDIPLGRARTRVTAKRGGNPAPVNFQLKEPALPEWVAMQTRAVPLLVAQK